MIFPAFSARVCSKYRSNCPLVRRYESSWGIVIGLFIIMWDKSASLVLDVLAQESGEGTDKLDRENVLQNVERRWCSK